MRSQVHTLWAVPAPCSFRLAPEVNAGFYLFAAAIVILCAIPVYAAFGYGQESNRLAVVFIGLMTVAVGFLLAEERRRARSGRG